MDNLPKNIRRMHVIDGIFVGDKRAIYLLDSLHEAGISHALIIPELFSMSDVINADSSHLRFNLPVLRRRLQVRIDDPTRRIVNIRLGNTDQAYSEIKKRYHETFDEVLYASTRRDARISDDVLKAGIDFVCKHVKAGHKVLIITDNVVYGTPMVFIFGYLLDKGYPLPELVRGMVSKVNVPRLYRHHWEQLLAHFNQSYTYEDIQRWVLEGWQERGAGV